MNEAKPKQSVFKWIVLGIVIMGFGSCGACVFWLFSGPEGGVRSANQMEAYALAYLEQHGILEPNEKLLSYYDDTINRDGTKAAILTEQRIIYHNEGRNTSIALADVDSIDTSEEPLIGDIIDVTAKDGTRLRIEIAPLNGGKLFIKDLTDAWERAKARAGDEQQPNADAPAPAR